MKKIFILLVILTLVALAFYFFIGKSKTEAQIEKEIAESAKKAVEGRGESIPTPEESILATAGRGVSENNAVSGRY